MDFPPFEDSTEQYYDDGYFNSVEAPSVIFLNQNSTMKDLENIAVTVKRSADVNVDEIKYTDAEGVEQVIPAHTAKNTENSFVTLEQYILEQQSRGEDGDPDLDSYYIPDPIMNAITLKTLEDEDVFVETTNTDMSATLKPFKLREGVDPNTPIVGETENGEESFPEGTYDLCIVLNSTGTRTETAQPYEKAYPPVGYTDYPAEVFEVHIILYIENDFGIAGDIRDIIARDPQATNYDFTGAPSEDVSLFDDYMKTVAQLAMYVYAPKTGLFGEDQKAEYVKNLEDYQERLQGYSKGAPTSTLESYLTKILGDNDKDDEDETDDLKYYDPGYVYFGSADYLAPGFSKLSSAIGRAQDLIKRAASNENPPTALEIGYAEFLLKETADFKLQPSDEIGTFQLVPTVASQGALFYQFDQIDPTKATYTFPNSNVTMAELLASYNELGPDAAEYLGFDGDSVRNLMNAYNNVVNIKNEVLVLRLSETSTLSPPPATGGYRRWKFGISASNPLEYPGDESPIEKRSSAPFSARITQSRLTRARDELVYAIKHVIPAKGADELKWSAAENAAEVADVVIDVPTDAPSYVAAYQTAYNAAKEALEAVLAKKDFEDASVTQEEIDNATKAFNEAAKHIVAILPNEAKKVFNSANSTEPFAINFDAYQEAVVSSIANGGFYLDESPLYDAASDTYYDGYVTSLDILKPSVGTGDNALYTVVNGTAEVTPNSFGKENTGATVVVKDLLGNVAYTLKVIYFGDVNGNGTILDSSDQAFVKQVVNGQTGSDSAYGENAVSYKYFSMDVVQNNTIDIADLTQFKTAGTRYVTQKYQAGGDSLVVKGKAVAPK
jgi:hypothetical protein